MEHKASELRAQLEQMYPIIVDHGLSLNLEYHPEEGYWIVKLEKGHHKLHTHLEIRDADACLEGTQCIYLGVQIGQFIKNFEVV